MTEEPTKFGVSRRTLAKGAALSVPAAAVVAVAPSVAASPPPEPPECATAYFSGTPCRISNQNLYRFGFCIENNCDVGSAPLTFTITELRNGADKLLTAASSPLPQTVTLEAGEEFCVPELDWTADSNSSVVWIRGYMGTTGTVTTLWTLPAPQKVDSCAGGTTSTSTTTTSTTVEVTTSTTTEEVTTSTTKEGGAEG